MKKTVTVIASVLLLAASSASANPRTDPRNDPPGGGGERGDKAYQAACAFMWMLGYSICLELPGAPQPRERQREA